MSPQLLNRILFLPLELPALGDLDLAKLDRIEYRDMLRDDYRNCYHINLLTSKFESTPFLSHLPELKSWLALAVLPIFLGRVMIIVTPPKCMNPVHIDCSKGKFHTVQQKFRFVLRGSVSDLVFVTNQGRIRPEEVPKPFLMEGKWPHYMYNSSPKRKYTLAVGWPWEPDFSHKGYLQLSEKSAKVNWKYLVEKPNDQLLPDTWKKMFLKGYPDWHKRV